MHDLEEQLEGTIGYLSSMEHNAGSLQQALQDVGALQSHALVNDQQAQERLESSATASTQVRFPSLCTFLTKPLQELLMGEFSAKRRFNLQQCSGFSQVCEQRSILQVVVSQSAFS